MSRAIHYLFSSPFPKWAGNCFAARQVGLGQEKQGVTRAQIKFSRRIWPRAAPLSPLPFFDCQLRPSFVQLARVVRLGRAPKRGQTQVQLSGGKVGSSWGGGVRGPWHVLPKVRCGGGRRGEREGGSLPPPRIVYPPVIDRSRQPFRLPASERTGA